MAKNRRPIRNTETFSNAKRRWRVWKDRPDTQRCQRKGFLDVRGPPIEGAHRWRGRRRKEKPPHRPRGGVRKAFFSILFFVWVRQKACFGARRWRISEKRLVFWPHRPCIPEERAVFRRTAGVCLTGRIFQPCRERISRKRLVFAYSAGVSRMEEPFDRAAACPGREGQKKGKGRSLTAVSPINCRGRAPNAARLPLSLSARAPFLR